MALLVSINRFAVLFFTGKAPIAQVSTLINVKLSVPGVPLANGKSPPTLRMI